MAALNRRHNCLSLFLLTFFNHAFADTDTRFSKRTDDLNLSDLRALVEQQAQVIDQLQGQLTATNNRLQEIENKLPATFRPVAFTVRFAHDNYPDGLALGDRQTLDFDAVITNIGNGYNQRTGVFTAPVAGLYSFFLTQMSADSKQPLWLNIVKNGATLDRLYTEGSNDTHDQGSSQVTTHLAAGDEVWVRQDEGDAVRGSFMTIFTGYLVQAD